MKRFTLWLVYIILLFNMPEADAQTKVLKADFMNKSTNKFMEKVPADIYTIAERIEPDGSLKIKYDSELTKEEILNIMGVSSDYTFELKRENKSFTEPNTNYKYYQQFYKNVRVEGGGYLVTERAGKIFKFAPNLYSEFNLNVTPLINQDSLNEILDTNILTNAELLITQKFENEYKLIWEVHLNNLKRAYVDAMNGKLYEMSESMVQINGTTRNFGTVSFNNFYNNGYHSLSSADNRIKIYRNFNTMFPVWNADLIPITQGPTWDDPTIASKQDIQALYVTELVDQEFSAKLGVTFDSISVGTIHLKNAYALPGSKAALLVGRMEANDPNGANFAHYDVIAHELGHILLFNYLDYDPGYQNAVLHEGLADIYGCYIENGLLSGGTDWIEGAIEPSVEEEINRNHTTKYCYENNPSDTDHQKSRAISRWFHNITVGIPDQDPSVHITPLGIELAKNIALEALNRITDPKAGIYYYKYLTLGVTQEMFGIGSIQYTSVLNAWNEVCVTSQCPIIENDITISSGQSVIIDAEQSISGNIIIENGGELTIYYTNIYLKDGKSIQVKNGGTLNLSRAILNTCNGQGVWGGVIAETGSHLVINFSNIYNAKTGLHLYSGLNTLSINELSISGNSSSETGIKLSKGSGFFPNTFNLPNKIIISNFKTGILCESNTGVWLSMAKFENCHKGIDIYGGNNTLQYNTFVDCTYPISLKGTSLSTISNNTISGDFYTAINCVKSPALIESNAIGTEYRPGGTGINCYDSDYVLINKNHGIFANYGIKVSSTYAFIEGNHIDVKPLSTGIGIYNSLSEQNNIENNTITTNGSFCGIFSRMNTHETINNNEINFDNPTSLSSAAIRGGGKHGGSISQNIINAGRVVGILLNNCTAIDIQCNHILAANVSLDIAYNSDLHTIKGNYMDASVDLQTRSVLGVQAHHGNAFVGGNAEAIGLDFEEILQSQFKVDPTFPYHLPTNPIPGNGQWFETGTNPSPFTCYGVVIGPGFSDGGMCAYWTQLKKLNDTQPNRFFINLFHLLYRAKKDTSFHLPNCIQLDPLLTQLCGVTKITDIFAALTKPTMDRVQAATLRQYGEQYAAASYDTQKDTLRGMMVVAYQNLQYLNLLQKSQDSLRLDSLAQELHLMRCDSIIIQKWKEILILYTKFKQKDSVDIADRSALLTYSKHCADTYGDAIYLARIMAHTFTDEDFEQYDGCISAPSSQPKVSATQDILTDVRVAPNPTNGIVHIGFSKNFTGSYRVVDVTGKHIISSSYLDAQHLELNLSNYPGLNFIQLTSDKGEVKVFKILLIK